MSISGTIYYVLSLISRNLNTSRDHNHAHSRDSFVIPMLTHHMANQCRNLKSLALAISDILGGQYKFKLVI